MKTEDAAQSIPVTSALGSGINATKEIPSAETACVTRLELAELMRVSVRTVDRMIAAGEIPVRRVRGRAVRFLRSDVERYLGRSSNATPHPDPLPDRGGEGIKRKSTNPAL